MSEPLLSRPNSTLDQRSTYAYRFSVGSTILFTLILIITFVINKSITSDPYVTLTLAACIIAAIVSARFSRQGKSVTGILILLGSLVFLTASRVFITKGLAISSGIINIIVITSIAVYTLPRKWVSWVVTVAFINAAITILLDQYLQGVPPTANAQIANIIAYVVGAIFLVVLAFQFPRLSLRAKLIIGFVTLTALPVSILGVQTYFSTRNLLKDQIRAEIMRSALSLNAVIQDYADGQFSNMQSNARATEISNYLYLLPAGRSGSDAENLALAKLKSFKKDTGTIVRSLAVLDLTGKSILDTDPKTLGTDYSKEYFFNYVITNKKPYATGLYALAKDDFILYFAVPIYSTSNNIIGVYLRTYNGKAISLVVNQHFTTNRIPGRITEYSYVMDDTNFFILGHSNKLNLVNTTYLSKTDSRIPGLIAEGLLDADTLDLRTTPQAETVKALSQMGHTASFLLPSPSSFNELAESAAVRVNNTDWIVLTSEPDRVISLLIQGQSNQVITTSIVLIAIAALLGLIAANFFTGPITELTEVAQSISSGDFTKRATIRTKDEIGLLADSINVMTDEIQHSIETLESRVERRTSALAQATQESEKRAQNLQTIAEISRTISTEKDQEKLLSLITQIVSEKFGFYHVGIFLLDETKAYAVLRAANSAGGQEMLRRKHSLKVGQTGIVGYVTSTGSPRIALDTGADAVFFNNPSLPETHSEMALPLTTRGTIIGALDVQSKVPNAFTDTDISIISLLADQIAIAIDNSRLLEAAQASIEETRAVFSEYLADSWQKKTESGVIGYRQTQSGGQVITRANMPVLIASNNGHGKPLEIPIRVREQVIGVLNIRSASEDREWTEDDMSVVEAVAERLGLALDNARLFEETSTRATRERQVAEITTKIRGSNDPQEMINTAMEELKQVLGASKVEILTKKINPSPDK